MKNLFLKKIFFLMFLSCAVSYGASSINALRTKASKGDVEAAFYLGNAYFYGEKTRKDQILAVYWYRKAAEGGIPEAQYNYACCLEAGTGIKRNVPDSFAWYEKASKQGFAPATFRLARFYSTGIQDAEGKVIMKPAPYETQRLLEELVGQEYEPAEMVMLQLLMRHSGSAEQHQRAFQILNRMRGRKEYPAAVDRMLADCYFSGYGCSKDRKKTVVLLEKAAERGDAEALVKLGFLYEYGTGVPKDAKKSQAYYKRAADANHPMGQFKYAENLTDGCYPGKNISDAMPWYQKSAKQNCPQALFKLGVYYLEGTGCKKDTMRAAQMFFRASKRGYARAQYNLACMFYSGQIGQKPDHEAAFYWFQQAAEGGDVAAQERVADCYLQGDGVERSATKAEYWLKKAVEAGDWSAKEKLNLLQSAAWSGTL